MTVVGENKVARYARRHSDARPWLGNWLAVAKAARWQTIQDVKAAFPAADGGIRCASGILVTVFDVGGNNHRLITAVNYRLQVVVVRELMTHAEYSKDLWKKRC